MSISKYKLKKNLKKNYEEIIGCLAKLITAGKSWQYYNHKQTENKSPKSYNPRYETKMFDFNSKD